MLVVILGELLGQIFYLCLLYTTKRIQQLAHNILKYLLKKCYIFSAKVFSTREKKNIYIYSCLPKQQFKQTRQVIDFFLPSEHVLLRDQASCRLSQLYDKTIQKPNERERDFLRTPPFKHFSKGESHHKGSKPDKPGKGNGPGKY